MKYVEVGGKEREREGNSFLGTSTTTSDVYCLHTKMVRGETSVVMYQLITQDSRSSPYSALTLMFIKKSELGCATEQSFVSL